VAFIINPGSELADNETAVGWTNTHEVARRYAYTWFLKPMQEQGFTDIRVTDTGEESDGRWKFLFTHEVTGKVVELEVHGIDDLKAYEKQYIFTPRVYWNGSSSSDPELEQFSAEGFVPVMTFRANTKPNSELAQSADTKEKHEKN